MQLSERVKQIASAKTLEMAAKAREMRAQGIDVISMSLGEPDMDTPEHIRNAAHEAIEGGYSHYGPIPGIPSLREAVAEYQNRQSADCMKSYTQQADSIVFTGEDVIVSVGAKMAIYNAIQTIVNPGDEVIIPMPSWVSYQEMVKLAEGRVVAVPTKYEQNYCLTPEELRAALTERTRMLILCSPNNPTGSIYSREQLQGLVDVLRDFPQVTILSDEIYACLSYDAQATTMSVFQELADRLVIINGVSKAYAMTGYRIGWMLSKNKPFVVACTRLQGQQLTCATMVAQRAAEAALLGDQACVEEMKAVFAERRELICKMAKTIPGWMFRNPQGAFYLFPDVSELGGGDVVAERLLEEAHVAVVSGAAFGCPECIRLSYAISTEQITEAMRRIANCYKGHL